jgi:hypothetical protein
MSLDVFLTGVDLADGEDEEAILFRSNYTHNVCSMWIKAGVFEALYESQGVVASELVEILERGVAHMEANPEEYKPLNPPNGWGCYERALAFLREYMEACRAHPKARVYISR